ncbi:hornerin-like [Paramacrobiotus metropolitanus]|uniref:hornerin-like n=1 Tax=Paramacrobiotus metropolitanus TaxID=2943436 RepID=UPI002445B57B|nr:hornerin-like [Paramacrobiotus metropolitanus]
MRTSSTMMRRAALACSLLAVCAAQYMPSRQSAGYAGGYGEQAGLSGSGGSGYGGGSSGMQQGYGQGQGQAGRPNGYGYSSAYQDTYNSGSSGLSSGGASGYASGGSFGGSGLQGGAGSGSSSGRGQDNGNPLNRLNPNYLGPRPDYCKRPTGQFSVPNDCTSFYNCYDNIAWIQKCPEGLGFNEQTYQCDYAEAVGCAAAAQAAAAQASRLQQQSYSSGYNSGSGSGYSAGGSNYGSQSQGYGGSGSGSGSSGYGSFDAGYGQQQQQGGQYGSGSGSGSGSGYNTPMYNLYASAGGADSGSGLAGSNGRNNANTGYRPLSSQGGRALPMYHEGRDTESESGAFRPAASDPRPQMQPAPNRPMDPRFQQLSSNTVDVHDPQQGNAGQGPHSQSTGSQQPWPLPCPDNGAPRRQPWQDAASGREQLLFANETNPMMPNGAGPTAGEPAGEMHAGKVVFGPEGPQEQPAPCHPCQQPAATCPSRPEARCFDDVCGGCRARFFERRAAPGSGSNGTGWQEVTDQCNNNNNAGPLQPSGSR